MGRFWILTLISLVGFTAAAETPELEDVLSEGRVLSERERERLALLVGSVRNSVYGDSPSGDVLTPHGG